MYAGRKRDREISTECGRLTRWQIDIDEGRKI